MTINFPDTPTTGQLFTGPGNQNWVWDGVKWALPSIGQGPSPLIGMQVFTNSGTYTPTPGMASCLIECVGGGGGGGGASSDSSHINGAPGGGAGGYSRRYATAAQIGGSQVVTIGAAGVGGTAGYNTGSNGGQTSVGALCVANGGTGAVGSQAASSVNLTGAAGGAAGTGDVAAPGAPGGPGLWTSNLTVTALGGAGGSGPFGAGGQPWGGNAGGNGLPASGRGSGGSGALNTATAINYAGGNGAPGLVVITEYGSGVGAQGPVGPFLRGYIGGLTLSTAGSSATFSVAAGQAADSTNAAALTLAAALNKTTAAWAAGNNNGALDTGTIANSTWYYAFLIRNPTTQVVDVLASLSATAPTTPPGFTQFRRIGAMKTDASGHWIAFTQVGDNFYWTAIIIDYNGGIGNGAFALSVTVPPISVECIGVASMNNPTLNVIASMYSTVVPPNGGTNVYSPGGSGYASGPLRILTVNAQLMCQTNSTGTNFSLYTGGWIDRRGRDN